ncbi:MAG TPA: glycosyltransferase family 4 protein [Cyanophyceae cyanobacterium]
MTKLIVHVAEIDLSEESGMGRVSCFWKHEFERRGYDFIHIGLKQVGAISHPAYFPRAAFKVYQKLQLNPALILVHEPASGFFLRAKVPVAVFSHGIERRAWNLSLHGKDGSNKKPSLKTRLLFPYWRLRHCDLGLKKSNFLLIINQEDSQFAQTYYHKYDKQIFVFRNGIHPLQLDETVQPKQPICVLFNGSWIDRKGIYTLTQTAQILNKRSLHLRWLLIGTGSNREAVLKNWASELHPHIEVIPHFQAQEEAMLLARANIFVLPSFFEGQPLSLLQAMAAGRCCITTDCCGQKDLITSGYNGLLYQPGDALELANLIAECAIDEALRLTLGRNARLSVSDRTWQNVSKEVVDHVEQFLHQV